MAQPTSPSILIVGPKTDVANAVPTLGNSKVSFADDFEQVNEITQPIVVMPCSQSALSATEDFLARIENVNPLARKILICADLPLEKMLEINGRYTHLRFVGAPSSQQHKAQLVSALTFALKEAREARPEKPKKSIRSQKRKEKINLGVDALHRALMAIHTASSVSEIENQLFEALKESHQLIWVRVFLHGNENLDSQLDRIQGQHFFKHGLMISAHHLGKIVMARNSARAFTKTEDEALIQISESVALALDRIAKIDQAENLKQQWESTFDAISEPLCITDEEFQIIRTNRAFLNVTKLKNAQAVGENCFKAFCQLSAEVPSQVVDQAFVVSRKEMRAKEKQTRFYEVTTQRIRSPDDEYSLLLELFRDITERKRLEDRIFESAKMAELGTVGSSIAHDINNPLGGMISFLQLIKMDMKSDHPLRADIEQMEAACHRCKEIVENLLQFSRRQENGAAETLDLRSAVKQAVKIIELQTRSLGIEIEITEPEKEVKILGHFNLLSQALSHIFQTSSEAVAERLKQNPGFRGSIKIDVKNSDHLVQILITDNGVGVSPEQQNKIRGLSQTLVDQILAEHGGSVEILARSNVGTTAKIAFVGV